jgi:pimeloyl-ACP methyl ester carboxylesterase
MSPSTSRATKPAPSRPKPRPKRSGGSGPTLAPQLLSDLKPEQREITLHGHRVAYRQAGESGPVLLLIHGITGNARQWDPVMPLLAQRYQVIAPDLLGHGESAKPRGDYSLGAYAAGIRDLLVALGHRRATVVGHSLGGGIAMQFVYEYPPFAERLVLVNSGGLGREVHMLLRAASLPGSELVLPLLAHARLLGLGEAVGSALRKLGFRAGPDLGAMATGYASLGDAEARQAFVQTIRAVIDPGGQRVSANDRLYLTSLLPSLIVWGDRDQLIPVAHAEPAHRAMPGSRLELFEGAGHFPQLAYPVEFADLLIDFMETTEPAQFDFTDEDIDMFRQRLLAGAAV